MAEPFSTTDVYYVNANNKIKNDFSFCSTNQSMYCDEQNVGDISNCECKYKENVDKLNTNSSGLTKEQNVDFNTGQSVLILNNISLGIGIVGMMWIIYSNST